MFSIQNRILRATQAQLESLLDTGARLADAAMHSVQQVTDLNLSLARVTLEQSNFAARQLMSAQHAEQVLSLAVAQLQPGVSRTLDYGYYLTTITADAQAGVIEAVGSRVADVNRELNVLAANIDREAPSGFRAAMQLLGSLVEGLGALYAELACMNQRPAGALGSGGRQRLARP